MRIAIPTNDHHTISGNLGEARGVMVYLIEDGQVKGRLFRYFRFWKILKNEGLKDRFFKRFSECFKECDWLVVKGVHPGLREYLISTGIKIHETNRDGLEDIVNEVIQLFNTNKYV
ncbi:MAG TPA: hypothetical protein ENK25_05085 [Bacteroidetes bacterium]|nr:hypothetical protein [Bacteroidota bacterium]